ncbi:hypothetical protein [Cellulophaga sp. Z1A5H]|uniref:hypothetical protein n=1 Tax=Cellulophaga sp. Z1A5H TaxID=2687291 RepID=UPI0013FE0278|nr:hypothetical protein [Cellulophaga sp. Z1A5H]
MKKNIIALCLLYSIQFIFTACTEPCNCDDASIFEVSYTAVDLTTYDTSGFQNSTSENDLYKNAFGLEIYVVAEENQIAENTPGIKLSGFGFNSALACSCEEPEYIYLDPLRDIEILVLDVNNQVTTDVIANFTVFDYYADSGVDLKEYFQARENWRVNFLVDLVHTDNIPDQAIFTINITLESGEVLTQKTNEIVFN